MNLFVCLFVSGSAEGPLSLSSLVPLTCLEASRSSFGTMTNQTNLPSVEMKHKGFPPGAQVKPGLMSLRGLLAMWLSQEAQVSLDFFRLDLTGSYTNPHNPPTPFLFPQLSPLSYKRTSKPLWIITKSFSMEAQAPIPFHLHHALPIRVNKVDLDLSYCEEASS